MVRGKILRQLMLSIIFLGVLGLLLAFITGNFHKKIEPGERTEAGKIMLAPEAAVDVVHKVIQTQQARVVGTVRAKKHSDISARIMARIVEMKVRAGDRVKEGDLLARLDDAELKANAERARQAMAEAEANLHGAMKGFERASQLKAEKVASDKEFDDAELKLRAAQAQVKQTSESLSAAKTMLSYAAIVTPFNSVVVDRQMDVGDTTQPGKPILTLYDPSVMRLEAAVPEALATPLKVGNKVPVALESEAAPAGAGIVVEPGKGKPQVEGTIEEIVPQAEALSRSVLVKVSIPPGTPGAIDGAFGRLLIPDQERIRICVASSAVKEMGQLSYVDVVKSDGSLERRMVQLGERSPYGRVEALSGLEPGEKVVLYGPPPQPLPEGVRLFEGGR